MLSHGWLLNWYYTCVCLFLPLWFQFTLVFLPQGSHGAMVLVYPLLFLQISFLEIFQFLLQLLNTGFWLVEKIINFLLGSLVVAHMDMPIQYTPSEVLHWWMALTCICFSFGFLLGSLLGVSFGLPPWLAPSKVLLGGLISWIFPLG